MLYPSQLHSAHVCCTQSPCPCGSPLLTRTFTGDTQTRSWLSLCGVSGSWWAQGLFEPSERLWRVWGLILNAISSLLPSCWGFSFALGHGVSPQSCSSAYRLAGASLPLAWGISPQSLQCHAAAAAPALHSHCHSSFR